MVLYGWPVPYTKSRVNRAGGLCSEYLRAIATGKRRAEGDQAELAEAIAIIDWWRSAHAKPLSRVAANLSYYAAAKGKPIVTQRLKKLQTMIGKLFREPGMKLARMEDIGGVRAVLPSQDACYRVASQLRRNWTITRFRDYVANPKADGYRALHLINRNRGRLIEVQLRTPFQDSWANLVEEISRVAAPGLKFGGGPKELREYLLLLGDLGAQRDLGLTMDHRAFARLQDLRPRVDTLLERVDEP
jgi:putative GTP pyrophosphokinase